MRTLLTSLLLLLFALAAQAAEPGRESFDAAVAAYRSGHVAGALRGFEQARAAGYDTPQLRFNLGLCYYRLRRYAEARAQFEALRAEPGYTGAADFHLALIAAREGDRARAESLWRSLESGPDPALAERAGAALGRLDGGLADPVAAGYLLLAAGYDSNPALLDESLQPPGGAESADTEMFAAFSLPVGGNARAFTSLRGGAYLKAYAEESAQDQRGAFAGVGREFDDGATQLSLGLDASRSTLDGERFLDVFTAQVQRSPSAGAGWRLGAQASLLSAPPAYAHLEGWRARLGIARSAHAGRGRARLGYEFEYNDRQDLATGGEFFSHSPLRHRVEFVLDHPLGARNTLRWDLRYRNSRYRDPDATAGGAERRVENLTQGGLQFRRKLGESLFALAEAQYVRNTATPKAFQYERATALIGLEWTPTAK